MSKRSVRYDRLSPVSGEQGAYDTIPVYDNGTYHSSEISYDGQNGDYESPVNRPNPAAITTPKHGMHEDVSSLSQEAQPDNLKRAIPSEGSRWPMLRDSVWQILLCFMLFLLPLALTIVLMYLVYANAEAMDDAYSITDDNVTRSVSDQEYYVRYSATTLVFISSLSSTLALALVPVGMTLFTYKTASTLQGASIRHNIGSLPTPYQFELCLRLLGGSAMELYRYLQYMSRPGSKRVPMVKALIQAVFTLTFLLALALAITITDALLHIKTTTVQYHQKLPFTESAFLPSRNLPDECLAFNETQESFAYACNIQPGGSGARQILLQSAEAYRILGNISENTFIQLADDGKTAIIGAANAPSDVSYVSHSFASSTVCEMVTRRCDPHYNGGSYDASQSWAYDCTSQDAGLVMSGNFTFEQSNLSNLMLRYFNTSSKTENGSGYIPNAVDGNIWSSAVFVLPKADYNVSESLDKAYTTYYNSTLDLIRDTYGNIYGILSCNTTLSTVQYTAAANGAISNISLAPMNSTASAPFFQALYDKYGDDNLDAGLNTASVTAKNSEEIAYQYARTFDRTVLGLTAGYLNMTAPQSAQRLISTQVAKVPIPEFIALNILNLLLTMIGVLLTMTACLLRTKPGVADIRARLDIGALVAALFEDKELGQTAHKVEDMYAELRGLSTSRVMASDVNLGDRRGFVAVKEIGEFTK